MLQMYAPSHPGELLKQEVIAAQGLTITEAASVVGVGRPALSAVLNGRVALSPEMALRFEKAFGISMELLLKMQLQFDIAQARKALRHLKISKFKPAA